MQYLRPNTTLQGGKYRIEQVLGQGGFGITYLATQVSSNRQVAIKELFIGGSGQAINDRRGNQVVVTNSANQQSFNQQKAKFKKEALRLSNLNHPNLVKVHEFFEENGTAYYVMDYIDGESLRTKLNREGVLSEGLVLKYIKQILPALEVAHNQSIWHLDIKPENVMVDWYGHTYLIDFGASKHIEQNSTLTTSLALAYTRGYCPPELADLSYGSQDDFVQALKDIGPWTDFYALGATMYNLLTDNIPPSSSRLYKDGRNAFMFPNNVSSSTRDLIVWMMKPNREERPQMVKDILSLANRAKRDDESTILEGSQRTENDNTSDTQYHKTPPVSNTTVTEGNGNSTIWWIIGIAIAVIICIFIYINQKDADDSSNNDNILINQNLSVAEKKIDPSVEETATLVDEETEKKQKEQAVKDSYLSIIDIHSSKDQDDEWWSPCYFLYDITNDGIPELWLMVKDRTANTTDASILVYTYTEKGVRSIFNGSYGHPYHNYLCKGNGYVLKVYAHMGEAYWSKYTYKNGAINEQIIFSEELNEPQEDYTKPSESEVNTFKLTNRTPINSIHIKK